MSTDMKQPLTGWKVWGGDRCDHCCNDDRCDDPSHYDRKRCPYCLGTGKALWLKPPSSLAKQVTNAQAEYDSWSPEKRASVRLEGSSDLRRK